MQEFDITCGKVWLSSFHQRLCQRLVSKYLAERPSDLSGALNLPQQPGSLVKCPFFARPTGNVEQQTASAAVWVYNALEGDGLYIPIQHVLQLHRV